MKPFYLLAIAAMLGIGGYIIPAEGESVESLSPQQGDASKSEPAFLKDASTGHVDNYRILGSTVTVPLAVSLPSDFDNAHIEWCLEHYRSYNPRDNTWISFSGRVRQCSSPFW